MEWHSRVKGIERILGYIVNFDFRSFVKLQTLEDLQWNRIAMLKEDGGSGDRALTLSLRFQ
jgi:hypothetical protein